jgi:hypothetical protein
VLVDRLSVGLFVISGLLLLSMGGAVVAAPLTLPLMYLAVRRRPTPAFRWAGGIIGGLTALEVAWAVVYVVDGEETPQIWLLPLVVAAVVLAAFLTAVRPGVRADRPTGTRPPPRPGAGGSGPASR